MIRLIFIICLVVASHQYEFKKDTPVIILNETIFNSLTKLVNETSKPD